MIFEKNKETFNEIFIFFSNMKEYNHNPNHKSVFFS